MNGITQSLYEQKIQSIAQELLDNGYNVSIEPLESDHPFNLGRYRPDIIASKNDKGIILEVKTSLKHSSIDRFQDIAERVAAHAGWRFMVVTLNDTSEQVLSSDANELPSWEELGTRLANVNTLMQQLFFEPSILFLWGIIEAALRKRAISQHLPIERFQTVDLIDHTFSSGEISISEFDLFKNFLTQRNKAAHGIIVSIDNEVLKLVYHTIQGLVNR